MLWLLVMTLPCLGHSVPVTPGPGSGRELVGIVGGCDVSARSYLWQVSLRFYNRTAGLWIHFCGGSLIHPQWVLTAAHCVKPKSRKASTIRVQVGQLRLYDHDKLSKVSKIVQHPDYDQILSAKAPLPPPYQLQEVEVPIVGNQVCNQHYHKVENTTKPIKDDMLCAGSKGQDSCKGDSGGALVCLWKCSWVQVGVVSWGHKCALPDFPGVYTRVTSYMSWIRQYVPLSPGP